MKEFMEWFTQFPEQVGELAKTWPGIILLGVLGAIMVAKVLQFGVEVVSSIVSWLRWRGLRVTVIQGCEIVAIGIVVSFGHQWLTLRDLYGFKGNVKCAFSRNRIDQFRLYVPGDENFLVRPGAKAKPPQSVSNLEEQKAEDEGDDGGE